MPTFASDSFEGANGTELSAHNPAWKKVAGFAASMQIANGRVRPSSTASPMYYYDAAPGSADYSVSADVARLSTADNGAGVLLRMSSSAATGYRIFTNSTNGLVELGKFVSGTYTSLGTTPTNTLPLGTTNLRFEAVGSALKLYKNADPTPILSVSDASISAAGYAGLRPFSSVTPSDTIGTQIDNFLAATPDAPAPTINSITASNITSSSARITLGLTR